MKKIVGWLCFITLVCGLVYGADVSKIATESRFDVNDPTKNPVGIMSIPKNEIRRIPDLIDNPDSQIGMWVPMIEPEPVIRGFDNRIQDNVRIYRNTGTTKDKYPYLVKVVSGPDAGKWYVYRNVKYHWVFEDASDDDQNKHSGGKNGTSGGSVWTPFYKASKASKALEYMRNIVNGTGEFVWDPKVYPNKHKKPFDSGISGTEDVKNSTVLQEVGMTLTYERAAVNPTNVSGNGYFGNADDEVIDVNSIDTAQLNYEPTSWEDKKIIKIPDNDLNIKSPFGGFTAINRVYVEDYSPPDVKGTEVKIYRGNVGGYITHVYNKATNTWERAKGILFEYEDDNPNANATSDRLRASLNYECGNMDLYKLPNPAYDPQDESSEPYIYFVYLPYKYIMTWDENEKVWKRVKKSDNPPVYDDTVAYGPYIGPAKKAEEFYYYKNVDPIWKKKSEKEVEEYIIQRYKNAYDAKSLPQWVRGLAYFILDERNSGLLKIKLLNAHVTGKKNKDGSQVSVFPELDEMINEYQNMGEVGKQAAADMIAFKQHLAQTPILKYNRFSYIEFKDGGRYCVGPIDFEKGDPEVFREVQPGDPDYDPKVKKGRWMIFGPRVILPKFFAINSVEWDHNPAKKLEAAQMSTDAQNYGLNSDGSWHQTSTAEDAGVPYELRLANENSTFINKYGHEWMQKVPDLMFKVDMADCCGNTTNQIGFIKVVDSDEGSKPKPEVEISDANGNTHIVSVPTQEEMEYGDKLVVKDIKTGEVKEYGQTAANGIYNGDNDLTNKEISIKKSDGRVQDPIGSSLTIGDKMIYEDTRLTIKLNAWDNIDSFYKYKGISSYTFRIQQLDDNGNPTGKYELLDDESGNKVEYIHKSIFSMQTNDRNSFNPELRLHHIFRNPGLYQAEYIVEDYPYNNPPNQQKLYFKIKVLNLKTDSRTIEDTQQRR